jgi:hypothetical protein
MIYIILKYIVLTRDSCILTTVNLQKGALEGIIADIELFILST